MTLLSVSRTYRCYVWVLQYILTTRPQKSPDMCQAVTCSSDYWKIELYRYSTYCLFVTEENTPLDYGDYGQTVLECLHDTLFGQDEKFCYFKISEKKHRSTLGPETVMPMNIFTNILVYYWCPVSFSNHQKFNARLLSIILCMIISSDQI